MGLAIMTRPTQTHAAPTELGSAFGDRRGYRHVAPNGACLPVVSTEACKEQRECRALSRIAELRAQG